MKRSADWTEPVAALAHAAGSHQQHWEIICNEAGQPARFGRLTRPTTHSNRCSMQSAPGCEPCDSSAGATVAEFADATGISISILSRLEFGQRRPTLDLLLLLLVARTGSRWASRSAAPTTGDLHILPRPVVRHGMTWLPLTRRPGGMQAFKLIVPAAPARAPPQQRVYRGTTSGCTCCPANPEWCR